MAFLVGLQVMNKLYVLFLNLSRGGPILYPPCFFPKHCDWYLSQAVSYRWIKISLQEATTYVDPSALQFSIPNIHLQSPVSHSGILSGSSIHLHIALPSACQVPLSLFHQNFCSPSMPGADQFYLFMIFPMVSSLISISCLILNIQNGKSFNFRIICAVVCNCN